MLDNQPPAPALPWTQAEWKYEPIPGYQYVVVIDRQAQIFLLAAAVPAGREAEIMANLRLAAHAPKLYAALAEFASAECGAIVWEESHWLEETLEAARQVLAEARGEQTNARL